MAVIAQSSIVAERAGGVIALLLHRCRHGPRTQHLSADRKTSCMLLDAACLRRAAARRFHAARLVQTLQRRLNHRTMP
jgi:hypothetical protein